MPVNPYREAGRKLKLFRTQAGLTKAELSRRLVVHRRQIDHIESGNRSVNTVEASKLCLIYQAMGVDPIRFLESVLDLNLSHNSATEVNETEATD